MGAAGFEISIFVTLFTLFSFPFCFPTVRIRASIQHKESRDCSTDFRKTFETLDTIALHEKAKQAFLGVMEMNRMAGG